MINRTAIFKSAVFPRHLKSHNIKSKVFTSYFNQQIHVYSARNVRLNDQLLGEKIKSDP